MSSKDILCNLCCIFLFFICIVTFLLYTSLLGLICCRDSSFYYILLKDMDYFPSRQLYYELLFLILQRLLLHIWYICLRGKAEYQHIVFTWLFWDFNRKTDIFAKNFSLSDLNFKLCFPVWVVAKLYVKFLGFPAVAFCWVCEISHTYTV